MNKLIQKLDLQDYFEQFQVFLARPKDLFLEGDVKIHLQYICQLEKLSFTPPPQVANLDTALKLIQKFGLLKLDEIYEFVKIIRYFVYLKQLPCEGLLAEWFGKIRIPQALLDLIQSFREDGELKEGVYLEYDHLCAAIVRVEKSIKNEFAALLQQSLLDAYFVDRQIHFIHNEECLLLKPGFYHALEGQILDRSLHGYFYVLPQCIIGLRRELMQLHNQKQAELLKICQAMVAIFSKHLSFLKFLNREFDRFDAYQARLHFAKSRDLEFLAPNGKKLCLVDFKHPALKNPIPISLRFDEQVLLITGVNAGGKTMLLKSILTVALLSKYLFPFSINAAQSCVGEFKHLFLVLEDPQNSKNDISTFGGRMLEFSRMISQSDSIIGIDEIELGTDSDEGASLFKVLLLALMQKGNKIIITTHHKRLAALMAGDLRVQLLAALFDEEKQMPTFRFLSGTIGKSYAFETAQRYGIPKALIEQARRVYGQDKEQLNTLIENSSKLERSLQTSLDELQAQKQKLAKKEHALTQKQAELEYQYEQAKTKLQALFDEAIKAAREAIKEQNISKAHRQIHHAKSILEPLRPPPQKSSHDFKVGDRVRYEQSYGSILSLHKGEALVQIDGGLKLRIRSNKLQSSANLEPKPQMALEITQPKSAQVMLDLHGLRAQEAIEKMDEFISNSLIVGFDEVLIYHGIGTGKLSSVVRDFLKNHPKVVDFMDAPPKSGGFGAKIVKL